MPGLQAAVASNTQALVQRNIVAGAMRVSQQHTAAAVVFSPCGQLFAWLERVKDKATLKVENRRTGQQVFSRPLPRPGKRRAARDRYDRLRSICWRHDSRWLTLTCVRGVFAADMVSGAMQRLSCPAGSGSEGCMWAPTADVLAVAQNPSGSQSLLSLYQISGTELHMAQQMARDRIRRVVWAANSQALAVQGSYGVCIINSGSQDQLQVSVPGSDGKSIIAWSPKTWDDPVLLCIGCSGEASFVDCGAVLKGRCEIPLQGEHVGPRHVIWGKHGVVVLTEYRLWLCNVCSGSSRLVLEPRLQLFTPSVHSLVLSPDQVHLCMVQVTPVGSGNYTRRLVLLNVMSGCQALVPLPEHLTNDYRPSWTSRGSSLIVPLVIGKSFSYKIFNFVL